MELKRLTLTEVKTILKVYDKKDLELPRDVAENILYSLASSEYKIENPYLNSNHRELDQLICSYNFDDGCFGSTVDSYINNDNLFFDNNVDIFKINSEDEDNDPVYIERIYHERIAETEFDNSNENDIEFISFKKVKPVIKKITTYEYY